jgi:hypothetical protein
MNEGTLLVLYYTAVGVWLGFVFVGLARYFLAFLFWRNQVRERGYFADHRMLRMCYVNLIVFGCFAGIIVSTIAFSPPFSIELMYRTIAGILLQVSACIMLYWLLGRQEESFDKEAYERERSDKEAEIAARKDLIRETIREIWEHEAKEREKWFRKQQEES